MIAAALISAAACDELRTATEPLPIGATLLVAPDVDTLYVGDTIQAGDSVRFHVAVRTYSGDTVDFTGARWESSDPLVATVDSTGLVTARGVGQATITAIAGERATATLVVLQATAVLVLLPTLDTLVLGDSLQLFAQAYDATGAPVVGVRYAFSADADTVATVDSVGLVRAVGVGDARIAVTAAGRQAFSAIAVIDTVTPPILP
ncbi:MAG TPA: Ig-like domain-containing protein [Gemmatimonadaceae bacterium]|nr:Ig-like domain-containing protein [Gemmatimonadaceae bacterium]